MESTAANLIEGRGRLRLSTVPMKMRIMLKRRNALNMQSNNVRAVMKTKSLHSVYYYHSVGVANGMTAVVGGAVLEVF